MKLSNENVAGIGNILLARWEDGGKSDGVICNIADKVLQIVELVRINMV